MPTPNRGPLGLLTNDPLVDDGTLVRTASGVPGPGGSGRPAAARAAHALARRLEATKGFSDHAVERMQALADPAHSRHMVGSEYARRQRLVDPHYTMPPPERITNCITYVTRVLEYAFEMSGMSEAASRVASQGDGVPLGKYLVRMQSFTGIYCNPDVNHPRDGDFEHVLSFQKATAGGKYYGIPVKELVSNYDPTPRGNPKYLNWKGMSKTPTVQDTAGLDRLRKVKFGVGLSRGGMHTWLYSYGRVYEVHWGEKGPAAYEDSDFATYAWSSHVIVVPPDTVLERLQDMSLSELLTAY